MKRPANKKIIDALESNFAILVNTANMLGCSRQRLKIWIDADPDLTNAYLEAKERTKDFVEYQLLKNIKDGKETSLIWYMKTQMRDRNYIDRNDTTMTIDAVKIKYIVPEDNEKLEMPLDNQIIKIDIPKNNEQ